MIAQETIRESTVSARGIELFVRERGDGFPLLLVNGLGGNVEMWGRTEERLAGVARTRSTLRLGAHAPDATCARSNVHPPDWQHLTRSVLCGEGMENRTLRSQVTN